MRFKDQPQLGHMQGTILTSVLSLLPLQFGSLSNLCMALCLINSTPLANMCAATVVSPTSRAAGQGCGSCMWAHVCAGISGA